MKLVIFYLLIILAGIIGLGISFAQGGLRVVPKTTPPSKGFVDFLHEREWRIPKDIDLKAYQPIGIITGIILFINNGSRAGN